MKKKKALFRVKNKKAFKTILNLRYLKCLQLNLKVTKSSAHKFLNIKVTLKLNRELKEENLQPLGLRLRGRSML